MSLLRIATTNLLELATTLAGPSSPTAPLVRLRDRNIKKTTRVGGASITGGTVTTDGAYTVHTFTESGTLVVVSDTPISASVLVVGGGGGGGKSCGGGGGGGGFVYNASVGIYGAMPITVGAGGAAGPGEYGTGGVGGSSSVADVVAAGGGGGAGAGNGNVNGLSGGSGGGGAGNQGAITTVGGTAFPSGQGYAGGGNAGFITDPNYPSGGGGGAGGVGGDGHDIGVHSGDGGVGALSAISGASVYYAGGGGGGANGRYSSIAGSAQHGGGAGGTGIAVPGANGAANTGGGGGGGGIGPTAGDAGNGGSGIVIIRYLTAALSASATREYSITGGISSVSVSALIIAAGHSIGGLAYTLAKSADGSSWTTVSSGTLAAGTGTIVIEFAATTGAHWKLALPDSTDAVLTEIFLTNIYTFTRNPARPSGALETKYNVETTETYSGSPRYIDRGDARRVREYDFVSAPVAMATEIKSQLDALGGAKDWWLCDHEGAWMFGNLTAPMAPAEVTATTRAFKLYFKESA